MNSRLYTRGAIGCALSHRALWEKCAASSPMIVFEDDAYLRRDFSAQFEVVLSGIKGFWDILLLGYNTNSILNVRVDGGLDAYMGFGQKYPTAAQMEAFAASRDPVTPLRLVAAFGCCGYVLSPPGARKLLDRCFPMDDRRLAVDGYRNLLPAAGIDSMMVTVYPTIAAYACFPPIVLSPNLPASSRTLPEALISKAGKPKGWK